MKEGKTGADNDLIGHCLLQMAGVDQLKELANKQGCNCRGEKTKKALADMIIDSGISLEELRGFYRSYKQEERERHCAYLLDVLKSGKLSEHDWCGASPSQMHRKFQDSVRQLIYDGKSVDDAVQSIAAMGKKIALHEFFMVARHDIIEGSIIRNFEDVIPEIGTRCLTDLVFNGVPYDLKVTVYNDDWKGKAGHLTAEEKIKFATDYYQQGDVGRVRKQAAGAEYDWGRNRMYVLVNDENCWLEDPEAVVKRLLLEMEEENTPFYVEELQMRCLVYEI